jgi:hypothetical protein
MGESARTAACRFSILLGLLLAALAWAAEGAHGGTYDVVTCDAAPAGRNASWTPVTTDKMGTAEFCPSAGREGGGLWAGSGVNVGTIPAFSAAQQKFDAPPGTSIVFFGARYMFRRFDPYWRLGVFADSHLLHGCEPATSEPGCHFNSQSIDSDSTWGWQPNQIHQVSTVVACGSGTGCRSDAAAPHGDRAGVRLYSATVRIFDDSAPALWDTGHGALTNGAWQRGTQPLWYAGSDNVGFRRTRLYVDGKQLRDDDRACDFTLRRPCSDVTHASYEVNTNGLADGRHVARVEGVDAAGNVGAVERAFNSDNTPPAEPRNVRLEGGSGWRQTNKFKVTWDNPPSASPIWIAHYLLCNVATNACINWGRHGEGVNSISDLSVPEPGEYTLRIALEDLAGNRADSGSDPITLRFDNVPPGEAEPLRRNGWLNAEEAVDYDQAVRLRDGAFQPVSGVAGYSVTRDGSEPDAVIDVTSNVYRIPELEEGVTTVRARAVSGAGVASAAVGTTEIRVDMTKPAVTSRGNPESDAWSRNPVGFSVAGFDQDHLSGMRGADPSLPVEEGAFIEHRVNGGVPTKSRGDVADILVADDGRHTVTFAAYDVAGNRSSERAVSFKIDRSPPELVVFEEPDQGDPRQVVVAASDRTSGVANGVVEMRRMHTDGKWIELATARDGDRFLATIDDESIERGVYQLRARVTDHAGNESTGDRRRDGSQATVDTATLRQGTRLTAGLVTKSAKKTKKVCSKKKPGKKRKCRKKTTTKPGGQLIGSLGVAFGKGAAARGTLENEAGAPLADAVVDVYARSSAAGSEFQRIGAVRTDPKGSFAYTVPPGTSRSVRFRYDGDGRHRSAEEAAVVKVAAAATITSSHKTRRNGQTVTFKGKLRSLPIPAAGKLLDLQAFYRNKWRTFATPRANPKGKWSYRYRFGATRGTVPYRFRVLIRPESAYPYDLGHSPTVRVVVRGR